LAITAAAAASFSEAWNSPSAECSRWSVSSSFHPFHLGKSNAKHQAKIGLEKSRIRLRSEDRILICEKIESIFSQSWKKIN